METLLSIADFVKKFPIIGSKDVVHAVNNINFSVSRGEVVGLVGESGSGKTTVGRCVLRLVEPTSGSIVFDGTEVNLLSQKEFRPFRSQMQMVFQDPYESLNPRMSIGEIIEEPLILFTNLNIKERRAEVDKVLKMVKIQPSLKNVYPHQISGGLQQRVGIARAIILNPKLVVLDEPTSALDISVRSDIVDLLFNLKEELGLSYIFISHDLTAVKYISDRIYVMYLGQIVEEGDAEELFDIQYMPYSRALLSSVLYPDVNQKKSNFILRGEIPSPINLPSGCYLASRCPLVAEKCSRPVDLKEVAPGRRARCIRVQEEGLGIYNEIANA